MPLKLFSRRKKATAVDASLHAGSPPPVKRSTPRIDPAERFEPAEATVPVDDPLHRQVQLERYGAILNHRRQWHKHRDIDAVCRQASEAIDDLFAMVPEGFVSLPQVVDDAPGCPEVDIDTPAFLLARYPVTQAQFQKFVDAGAYEELELWPQETWPHLIDFKDQTGEAGPRFWRKGRHDRHYSDHPVVGICWYEAETYARWAGYRLPSEAEWQMAASWRIRSSAHILRRYPWGDALDTGKCNIWASGVGNTRPVTDYVQGAAPNGVQQLTGNVWEWTSDEFQVTDHDGHPIIGDMIMKSIRGGAFDTYFAAQATSGFRTGLVSLARTHNVGFRCALDLGSDG